MFLFYNDVIKYGADVEFDDILFCFAFAVGFVSSVFCSLFIGIEYSDRTLHNKLIVGHSRTAIYFRSSEQYSGVRCYLSCMCDCCMYFRHTDVRRTAYEHLEAVAAYPQFFLLITAYCSVFYACCHVMQQSGAVIGYMYF